VSGGASFPRLVEIMARLLAPGGCPWDREQTLDSLRPFLVEETYEVLDAMERDDVADHREELGDLLMQVVFQAALREDGREPAQSDLTEMDRLWDAAKAAGVGVTRDGGDGDGGAAGSPQT
jgi:uncharacterized protein YabN with tetrapyrrole methylase and pyrophosphatase domain